MSDGFLRIADQVNVASPAWEVVSPLGKFGSPEAEPYTGPTDATQSFQCQAAATSALLAQDANLPAAFHHRLDLLQAMHERNPSFEPLLVHHFGNFVHECTYVAYDAEMSPSER